MSKTERDRLTQRLLNPNSRREAFEEVVRQYSEMLYWKIRRVVMFHEDADDVLQNTLMKAWANLDSFRGDCQLTTWLCRIAINESLDHLRKNQQHADSQPLHDTLPVLSSVVGNMTDKFPEIIALFPLGKMF